MLLTPTFTGRYPTLDAPKHTKQISAAALAQIAHTHLSMRRSSHLDGLSHEVGVVVVHIAVRAHRSTLNTCTRVAGEWGGRRKNAALKCRRAGYDTKSMYTMKPSMATVLKKLLQVGFAMAWHKHWATMRTYTHPIHLHTRPNHAVKHNACSVLVVDAMQCTQSQHVPKAVL